MTKKDIYKIWAPFNKKWVDWIRPVSFIAIDNQTPKFQPTNLVLPYILEMTECDKSTAFIVDLYDTQSVETGIELAKKGYRPVPIYNGTMEQKNTRATTDNQSILGALIWGANELKNINIDDNAPPAFLTDTNRLQRRKVDISVFDNSWDVYHQDLPTEDYFLNNGITKIIVISNSLSKDLKKIFAQYPKKKVQIFWTNGYNKLKCVRKGRK